MELVERKRVNQTLLTCARKLISCEKSLMKQSTPFLPRSQRGRDDQRYVYSADVETVETSPHAWTRVFELDDRSESLVVLSYLGPSHLYYITDSRTPSEDSLPWIWRNHIGGWDPPSTQRGRASSQIGSRNQLVPRHGTLSPQNNPRFIPHLF